MVPTATPSPDHVLEGLLFTITFDDTLLATEEIHVSRVDDQLVILSEVHRFGDYPFTERRTSVVSGGLLPLRYDLETDTLGVRSTWVGERDGDAMDYLNNNQAWYGPVLREAVAPAPEVMLETSPSALPFALLALRLTQMRGEDESPVSAEMLSVDILEDYPVIRPLTVMEAKERTGAVIGTIALEGQVAGAANPDFTVWVRPATRTLYRVEVPEYHFGYWQQLRDSALREPAKLVIQRVSELPRPSAGAMAGEAEEVAREEIEFLGADRTIRRAALAMPLGEGPFPVLMLHSPGGIVPRWDDGTAVAERGWAAFSYDQRGVGRSEGNYERGPILALAQDAVEAAATVREQESVDPQRVVFLGLGEAGLTGALVSQMGRAYDAVILGSCALDGTPFPRLADYRVRQVLAPFYGWDDERLDAYRAISVVQWQQWLFDGQEEVSLLRRRASLRALGELAATDLFDVLLQSQVPVLLLHGQEDVQTPVDGALALQKRLVASGATRVTLQVFEGLGADLGAEKADGLLAPEVEDAIFAWLNETLGSR